MSLRLASALALLVALSLACAGGGGVPSQALGDPIAERLEMEPFDGWRQVADSHTRGAARVEWVPAEQAADHARDRLTREVSIGKQAIAPRDFASERLKRLTQDCIPLRIDGPRPATEEGNDVAYTEVSCSRADGWTLNALFKVIRGHEALYLAERDFHYDPSRAELREARAYLAERVYLCPIVRGLGRCTKATSR